MALRTDYTDDILDLDQNTNRKYEITTNQDNSVSFTDVTAYEQEGSTFGASDFNATNEEVNRLGDAKQDKLTNPLTKSDVVNDLTTTTTNVPLSAAQGKVLKDSIDAKQDKLTNPLTRSNIVNNLTSESTTDVLSAAQGKMLKDDTVASISRNGNTFTAKNSAGSTLFTFAQKDTTTGTSYDAGSCPDNTTFGTNGSIKRVFDWILGRIPLFGTTTFGRGKITNALEVDLSNASSNTNRVGWVSVGDTSNLPSDCACGIREVYYYNSTNAFIKITGRDTSGTGKFAAWGNCFFNSTWTGWQRL